MSEAEDLDEALRAKLRAAAEQERVLPRPEAMARWSAALNAHAHKTPPAWHGGALALGVGLAAAASLALWFWPRPHTQVAQRDAQPAPACALPTALSIAALEAGAQQIALGRFGTLVASKESKLRIERAESCVLSLFLEQGELAGDLAQLKPAQLRVRTPHGTVVVRGTRFSVRTDDEFEVVLLSGRVDIEDEITQKLEPQHVYRKRGTRRETLRAQPPQAAHIDALLHAQPRAHAEPQVVEPATRSITPDTAPTRTPETAPTRDASASALLARAESERRQGEFARARALYRQASEKSPRDDAEVALLRWVRLELEQRAFGSARQLLTQHARRFADGKLRAEAAWLDVQALRDQGKRDAALASARALIARFPGSPQADAARALLAEP